ncbi:MAG TPA: beta-N-acetylhexosaminidase [Burkholderiales bacterium]|nr:beta-N-acetylhexosaminidase [Burkholderiales bacterium]
MKLGPVMLDVAGTALTAEERERLRHPLTGGVILFSRNYESPEQVRALVDDIHRVREPQLLIAVDHEGGRVQRFRSGFTVLPPMRRLGGLYDDEPEQARRLAENVGWVMAAELRAVGVDFSFAPVLDLDLGVSEIIGDRAFHSDPEAVADLAHALMRGIQRAGMAAVGKHFPGHGSVAPDSHVALPIDERSYAEIEAQDLVPFKRMIAHGLPGIMPAHVIYSRIDAQPAGFSSVWLKDVLRQRLGFQGVIFSDDLSMEGAKGAGDIVARGRLALAAGCDMVLVCNDPAATEKLLEGLGAHDDPASHRRLARLHGQPGPNRAQLIADRGYHDAVKLALAVASTSA